MAQYSPKTWVTGEPITAAELNAIEAAAAAAAVKADTDAAITAASTADRARANHTGTQSADTITDGTTNKAYTATEKTKLAGVATAATANATDAALRDRSTHTGTQPASTVTGLAGAVALVPTATKTAAYTAVVGDLAMMNVASGGTALTLPTAPADKSQVGYRAIGATTLVPLVVTAGGSDSIGTTGATSASIALADEVVVLQYQAASTRWLAVANVKTQASLDATTKTALAPALRRNLGVQGRIIWIVDDALITQRDSALPKIESVGGKLNFAVNWNNVGLNASTMVAADITNIYNRGHQIMSHSMTHPNMTTQTPAQRQAEWDTSKANLEAITAVGAITDFVYPNNASNLTTQQEAYGRYVRCFTAQNAPTVFLPGENGMHIGRNTWGTGTHQTFLAWIRRIAYTGETYVIFCHDVVTEGVSAINATMMNEAIDLATSLGVRFVRADEALIGHQPLLDPSFESGDLTGIYNSITTVAAGSTVSIVADPPSAGLMGTKSLQMVNDGNGALNRVQMAVVNGFIPRTSDEYTLSGRIRQEKTSGTGGSYFILRQWDEFGNSLGDVNTTPITAVGSTPWTQVSLAFTPNKLTRNFQLWCQQAQMLGTTWFDHVHVAPTKLGVLG